MQFVCHYGDSRVSILSSFNDQGLCEVSENHLGFHGSNGVQWIKPLYEFITIKEVSIDSICLLSDCHEIILTNIPSCHLIEQLLERILTISTEMKPTLCDHMIASVTNMMDKQQSILNITLDLSLPLHMRMIHRFDHVMEYMLSSRFYRLLLLSSGDYAIQVKNWEYCHDDYCCQEMKRDTHSKHVYKLWKKQIACSI